MMLVICLGVDEVDWHLGVLLLLLLLLRMHPILFLVFLRSCIVDIGTMLITVVYGRRWNLTRYMLRCPIDEL